MRRFGPRRSELLGQQNQLGNSRRSTSHGSDDVLPSIEPIPMAPDSPHPNTIPSTPFSYDLPAADIDSPLWLDDAREPTSEIETLTSAAPPDLRDVNKITQLLLDAVNENMQHMLDSPDIPTM